MMDDKMPPPQVYQDSTLIPLLPINSKYKTSLCKHFLETGDCHMGKRCHFAHGEAELRSITDSLPQSVIEQNNRYYQMKSSIGAHFSNYKSVPCKYFENSQKCKYGDSCTFAHGKEELRKPGDPLPPQYEMTLYTMYQQQMIAQGIQSNFTFYPMGIPVISNPNDPTMKDLISKANKSIEEKDEENAKKVITEMIKEKYLTMAYPPELLNNYGLEIVKQ
jgi:hypothetical protein